MIETIEGDHSYNFDELLTYLCREKSTREELASANFHNTERRDREIAMAEHYGRMYKAARFYRCQAPK